MTQIGTNQYFAEDVMSFLKKIEESFQEAESWLQDSVEFFSQKGYDQYLHETISYVQQAKLRVAQLRQDLPIILDHKESEFLNTLHQERASQDLGKPGS
jgi:hypothetical protein